MNIENSYTLINNDTLVPVLAGALIVMIITVVFSFSNKLSKIGDEQK